MQNAFEDVVKKLPLESKSVFEGIPKDSASIRFFSYGSNMNEEKFKIDMKEAGKEIGLISPQKRTLENFKRTLSNESKHGLAFTIIHCKGEAVEGICHDIPLQELDAFLKKEGLYLKSPRYRLIQASVADDKEFVLTLQGLCPSTIERLDNEGKWQTLRYVCESIMGAKNFDVNHSDMLEVKQRIEKEICDNTAPSDAEKLYGWGLQRQLTWAIVVLTCFVGLIELLPEMKWYKSIPWLSVCLVLIYIALAGGLSYSVYVIGITFEHMSKWEEQFPDALKKEEKQATLPHLRIVTKNRKMRRWIFWFVSVFSFVLWAIVLFGKLFS